MQFGNVLRSFGYLSILGGLFLFVAQLWFYFNPESYPATTINYIGFLFILFGLFGVYLKNYESVGAFGFIGFLLALIGLVLYLGFTWFQLFVVADILAIDPQIMETGVPTAFIGFMASLYTLLIGLLLFAISNFMKGKETRLGAGLIILAAIAQLIPYGDKISQLILGVAFIFLGSVLLKTKFLSKD